MADEAGYGDASDQDLLARHVEGDPDAFGELVRRHRDRLWAVALRTLGDREEAADAVQDSLVSAYRAAHTFRGQSAVTTWLHRITVNACLDRARKAASRKTSPVDDTERLEQLLEPHESASAPAERNDLHRQLIEALGTLPPDQRAALVLVDMQGYPVAAEISDLTEGLLPPTRTADIRRHVEECPLCADVYESLEEIRGLLGTLPGPPRMPDDVAGRIDAALAAEALLNATSPEGADDA